MGALVIGHPKIPRIDRLPTHADKNSQRAGVSSPLPLPIAAEVSPPRMWGCPP